MRFFSLLFLLFAALFADDYAPKALYVSYEPLPERLYVGQTIAIEYTATITERYYERLETKLGTEENNGTGVKRIGGDPRWLIVDKNRRKMTLFYRIEAPRAALPQVEVNLTKLDGSSDAVTIAPLRIGAVRIGSNPQFCGVVAENLEVLDRKIERYNDKQNILAMELQARLSNLSKFSIAAFGEEQGVDRVDDRPPTTKLYYYAIVPPNMSELSFNYFNPTSGDFKKIDLSFDISALAQPADAHADINPNKRSFPWLNTLLLAALSFALILASALTRKIWLLIAALAAIAAILFMATRDEQILIKTGAEVRLLPTETSTLFYTTDRPTSATLLTEKSDFVKVLLPDKKIGWVRKSEVD